MDGNKDAALKCMAIGQKALRDGDKARAVRFLSKAKRLDPSLPLEELLVMASSQDASKVKVEEKQTAKRSEIDPSSTSNAGVPKSYYTPEQMEGVRRIKKCNNDYYQILGLVKDCSAEEVKKAYKKISLKVHPDKNKAPGADEAFKAVSKAFVCLSDEEARKKYDHYGSEEDTPARQHYARRQNHYGSNNNGFYYNNRFDADEVFNTFFYGRGPSTYVRTRRATADAEPRVHVQTSREGHFGLINLIQLLPVLLLLIFTYFPFSQPLYRLSQAEPYHFPLTTKEHGVPFFVRSEEFEKKDHPLGSPSRAKIEAQVERDYTEILGYNCRQEMNRRLWNPSFKTPNCDALRRFQVY